MKTLIGRKVGMTQIFDEKGLVIPVTVIEAGPCSVVQIKTVETDGYDAVQLGFGEVKEYKVNKPEKGHFKKASVKAQKHLREFRACPECLADVKVGDEIKVDTFSVGDKVDIQGITKGKGFQGVIKRHGQSRGPMGHGSHYHRKPGSMGTMRPMRVFKGKKLPGHMGQLTVTIQNLEVVAVDLENNVILIKGNVPGAKNSLVIIESAVKNPDKVNAREELISYATEKTPENPESTEVEATVETESETVTEETTEVTE